MYVLIGKCEFILRHKKVYTYIINKNCHIFQNSGRRILPTHRR